MDKFRILIIMILVSLDLLLLFILRDIQVFHNVMSN
jgi:hypothetical protein